MPRLDVAAPPRQGPRERILRVAHKLFYGQGINTTGIDRIIADAQVAKQSFYKYFPSKQALVVTFLEQRHERWMKWLIGGVFARAKTPGERLLAVFDVLEEWFAEEDYRGCAFLNIGAEFSDPECPERKAARRHKRELLEFIAELTRAAKVRNARTAAEHLLLLIDGAIVRAHVERSVTPARQAKAIAATLLKRRARPSARQS